LWYQILKIRLLVPGTPFKRRGCTHNHSLTTCKPLILRSLGTAFYTEISLSIFIFKNITLFEKKKIQKNPILHSPPSAGPSSGD
jgi:hypothetical protein